MIRNRADARWLPTRFNFALARLIAFVICKSSKPRPEAGLVISIDRHQSALENYLVALWFYSSTVAYLYVTLQTAVPPWAALPLALFITPMALQLSTHLFSSFGTSAWISVSHMRLNNVILMSVMSAASLYALTTGHWTRHVGMAALGLLTLNGLSAVIMRLLAPSLAALEASFEAGR